MLMTEAFSRLFLFATVNDRSLNLTHLANTFQSRTDDGVTLLILCALPSTDVQLRLVHSRYYW